jgi:hypothetical protein
VAIVITTFVRTVIIAAQIIAAAVLYGLLAHARWYSCIAFGTVVVFGLWCFDIWQKNLVRRSAWLAIRTLALKSQEIERLKVAYSSRNLEETGVASEAVQAAIRKLE